MSDLEIPLSRPDITEVEEQLVLKVLRSGRLAMGPLTQQFETLVATRADCRYGIAVCSGTCGLHLALLALNIGPGDEVITTPFSFIASSNVILMVGAKPVFVDICPKTLNMDAAKVEAAITSQTKAILAVETFGNPALMDQYAAIANRHEIPLVEDCCEALGCTHRGRPAGHFGRVGVFGFYPNKQITTGEGGMIVTDDARIAEMCRSLRNQGRATPSDMGQKPSEPQNTPQMTQARREANPGSPNAGSWLHHERLGYNYRMSEVSAAIGIGQMRRLDEIIAQRQTVAQMYMDRLGGHPHLVLPTVDPESEMSWFVYVVRLSPTYTGDERDRIIKGLRDSDIGAGDYFPCIHLQKFYQERHGFRPGMFPIAETVSQRTIALPFFNKMTRKQVDAVASTLEVLIKRENLSRV
jgi:dTDP-4-amino-4,6-dideoxygalactose transaminase